ncbi:MAG TPA: copper resistance CopC family protein [Methylomirabilota bacterium]|nr:copper resistance CopC family protein [Methylomirabilota bacterium]
MFLAAVAAFPSFGWAHAVIVKSEPGAGGRVRGPVVDFQLQYNSRIDAKRSRLVLDLPDGSQRSLSIRSGDSLDMLAAKAAGLSPGSYRLHWQVLSVDGHITRGDIPFDVTP